MFQGLLVLPTGPAHLRVRPTNTVEMGPKCRVSREDFHQKTQFLPTEIQNFPRLVRVRVALENTRSPANLKA